MNEVPLFTYSGNTNICYKKYTHSYAGSHEIRTDGLITEYQEYPDLRGGGGNPNRKGNYERPCRERNVFSQKQMIECQTE
jgi:hypothetical protein